MSSTSPLLLLQACPTHNHHTANLPASSRQHVLLDHSASAPYLSRPTLHLGGRDEPNVGRHRQGRPKAVSPSLLLSHPHPFYGNISKLRCLPSSGLTLPAGEGTTTRLISTRPRTTTDTSPPTFFSSPPTFCLSSQYQIRSSAEQPIYHRLLHLQGPDPDERDSSTGPEHDRCSEGQGEGGAVAS